MSKRAQKRAARQRRHQQQHRQNEERRQSRQGQKRTADRDQPFYLWQLGLNRDCGPLPPADWEKLPSVIRRRKPQ